MQLDHERGLHELGRDLHPGHGAPATSSPRSRTSSRRRSQRLLHARATSCARATAASTRCSAPSRQGALQQIGTCTDAHPGHQRPARRGAPGTGRLSRSGSAIHTSSRRFNPADHICAPVDFNSIGTITESLTYNTYFKKWMLVGNSVGDPASPASRPGVYYAFSDDLINWTDAEAADGGRDHVRPGTACFRTRSRRSRSSIPTALRVTSRPSARRAQLFYTWYHMSGCNGTLDRDLLRVPIEFTNQQPGGAAPADGIDAHAVGRRAGRGSTPPAPPTQTAPSRSTSGTSTATGRFERDRGSDPTTVEVVLEPQAGDGDGAGDRRRRQVHGRHGGREAQSASSRREYCKQASWKQKRVCKER